VRLDINGSHLIISQVGLSGPEMLSYAHYSQLSELIRRYMAEIPPGAKAFAGLPTADL